MAFGLGMDSLGGGILKMASPLGAPLLTGLGKVADKRFLGPMAGGGGGGQAHGNQNLNPMQFGEGLLGGKV